MYYREFKGKQISALGMGGLRLPTLPGEPNRIDRKKGQAVIDAAISSGINYFDTAYTYQNGDSERFLGEALSKYPRDSYFLATKFYAAYATDIEAVFEEQLRRCQTDYFDFYLLHGLDENYISAYMDEEKGYLAFLQKQKERGRICNIGFSSHAAPATLARFLDYYDGFDMALIQLNYIDWTVLNAKRQYELLAEHRIPVWVMEPLKGGRLSTLSPESAKILKNAAPERSLSSWGFRYLMGLSQVHTVLSGMSAVEQVLDNARTFAQEDRLSAAEQEALEQAKTVFLTALGVPCSACRYCCPSCPAELNIPLLIQGRNEMKVSGETWRLAELKHTKGPEHCLQCGTCLTYCPQKIRIPDVLAEFAAMRGA